MTTHKARLGAWTIVISPVSRFRKNHSKNLRIIVIASPKIYENFYKVYDQKRADRLGVVYLKHRESMIIWRSLGLLDASDINALSTSINIHLLISNRYRFSTLARLHQISHR